MVTRFRCPPPPFLLPTLCWWSQVGGGGSRVVWKALPRVPSRVSAFGGASTPRSSRGSSVPFEGREVFGAPWFGRQGTYTSEAVWPVRAEKCYQAYNISWGFEFECILGCSMEAGGMWKIHYSHGLICLLSLATARWLVRLSRWGLRRRHFPDLSGGGWGFGRVRAEMMW